MKVIETPFADLVVIQPDIIGDERGFFTRTLCKDELAKGGLHSNFVQENVSGNTNKATLRGLHFQSAPYEEIKLVTCLRGAVWDVVVDTRLASPTWGKWFAIELNENNLKQLYIPKGFAHGFITLADHSLIHYHMSTAYQPNAATGIRWDDPDLAIDWPIKAVVLSEKDRSLQTWKEFNNEK